MYKTNKGQQLAEWLANSGITDERVLKAIASTPREMFVSQVLQHKAYENNALPIGQGQTISQPITVAKMTQQLCLHDNVKKVLEIGTGSGYQTAILAQLFDEIYSVERIKSLQFQAKRKLNQLNMHNVKMKHGDGWEGWKSKAPFDAIIVTAAAQTVPAALVEQLKEDGLLVLPVGSDEQKLVVVKKSGHEVNTLEIGNARFVPLIAGELA